MVGEVKVRVRYEETDQMGMVYHGKYFVWFEVGRTELFRDFGLPYTVLEANKIYLPVVEAHCQYKTSARYDDELIIKTRVNKLSGARIGFDYDIVNADGQLIAHGGTTHAFLNEHGKPVNVKKAAPWLWDKLVNVAEADNLFKEVR
ncbi:thioesterase superfamily protein [Thermincola ferriacetica]|uniref:Thioesterase superfamily protein n=1 Tax=Thermincola ferriacetica TaxID=281456 RepID=A0A0L6VZ71_9FIRM|nr:thioesterase family protein [Thermincola ferriacetica]KNZ68575.1 thioesterase superfamily protein [Thermincola ferriacetica]